MAGISLGLGAENFLFHIRLFKRLWNAKAKGVFPKV